MLTLLENVMLPMDFCNVYTPDERPERALALLRLVDLEKYADKLPAAVSGGQQQTAAIARALANNPPILIADEPTGNLDTHTAEAVFAIFTGLVEQGKTILMVTHDENLAKRTDRILHISDGRLVGDARHVPEWRKNGAGLNAPIHPESLADLETPSNRDRKP
jgi:putative ABC transport system ATP-binding protein